MSIFDGDGRARLKPVNAPFYGHSATPTRAFARKQIERFKAERTYFSATGGLGWVAITYCIEQGIEYIVDYNRVEYAGGAENYVVGYTVRML